jgi:nitrogen fixation protein FixH
MKTNKPNLKLLILTIVAFFMLSIAPNVYSQNLTSSSWTGWMTMRQNGCMTRARAALKLANIRQTENTNWFAVGKAKNLNVRIKCIADDNTNQVVNSNVSRMLVDIEVEGFTANLTSLDRLRNCLKEFIQTGKSTCWKTVANNTGTTSQMRVFAKQGWQPTGVRVKAGDRIKITAIGNVQYTPRKSAANGGRCGPVGVKGFQQFTVNPAWNHCALIAKIGSQVFLVGTGGTFTANQAGILEMRINDTDLGNNDGFFTTSITLY